MNEQRVQLDAPSAEPAKSTPGQEFRVAVPLGIGRQALALVAREALILRRGARVLAGWNEINHGEQPVIASLGSLELESEVEVGSIYALGATPVAMAPGSIAWGYLKTATNRNQLAGNVRQGALQRSPSSIEEFRFTVEKPAAWAVDVRVQARQRSVLAPGHYRHVAVEPEATLVVRTGRYQFESLDLAARGTLEVDNVAGAVYAWSHSSLNLSGQLLEHVLYPNILFGYAGSEPPKLGASLRATLVAPRASVRIPAFDEPHRGAFFARSIELDPGASVELRPFFAEARVRDLQAVCSECAVLAEKSGRDCCAARRGAAGHDRPESCEASAMSGYSSCLLQRQLRTNSCTGSGFQGRRELDCSP